MTSPSVPILIVPGLGNSGPSHWQSLWQASLPGAQRVEQLDWERPERRAWCDALERAVGASSIPPIVVAHSLGCLTVVHWARETAHSLAGALLVAPPDPTLPSLAFCAEGFAPVPLQSLDWPSTVVASANDPYASLGFAQTCAQAWGSKWVPVGEAGHINAASGLGQWDKGLELLAQLSARVIDGRDGDAIPQK